MRTNRTYLLFTALSLLGACQEAPPHGSARPVQSADDAPGGALLVATQVTHRSIDRVEYTVRSARTGAVAQSGTLAVADGVAEALLPIPHSTALSVDVRMLADGIARCEGHARDVRVEAGRTAQVSIVSHCGVAAVAKSGNRAPRIDAVFASRRNVRFGEHVAVAVSATDPDGDQLRYTWSESIAGGGFKAKRAAATGWTAGPRAIKRNVLQIAVSDGHGSARATIPMDFEALALTAGTCARPTSVKVGQTIRGFTVGAPARHTPNGCQFDRERPAPEHVYKVVLTTQQDLSVSVVGSAFFARVYVRRDLCDRPEAEVACDQGSQRVDLPAAQPGTYYVFVDGDSVFSQGEYQLSVFSGTPPEACRNFTDDDGDGLVDCADPDCQEETGCLECAFDCDPNPKDCVSGECDRFSGRCNAFLNFAAACETDNNPATTQACNDFGQCVVVKCGNGTVEPGEQCDDGNLKTDDACDAQCQVIPVCGNGIFEPGETCDDGNTEPGDGCEPNCTVHEVCGNGTIEGLEECDDGNVRVGDGCDASCRTERCGSTVCDDGNPCTVDACTDAATATCAVSNAPNGTPCDADGVRETSEQCRAGVCTAPPPDRALAILEPAVLALPEFSLRAMHDRLAADGDGALLFEQWATTLTAKAVINGRTAAARPGFAAFLQSLPRDTSGRINLDGAGFLPSAFVNRFDLRTPGNCGENRLVFTKTSGTTDSANRGTIIFEFKIPDDGTDCRTALSRWTALRRVRPKQLPAAVAALLEKVAQPAQLKTLRTNEFVNAPFWELREFHLVDGRFVTAPVVDSVPFALAQNPEFRTFVVQNATSLNRGAREIGALPAAFLDASSHADGQTLALGNIVPSLPGLEANIDILSCSGCHLTRTGTGFVHVAERTADAPSVLSSFMRSELEVRGRDLATFLAP